MSKNNKAYGFDRQCSFAECQKPVKVRGLCAGHDGQRRKGWELKPLRVKELKYGAVCTFPNCGLPHESRGYCSGHRQQQRKGHELQPLDATLSKPTERWINGRKPCSRCGVTKAKGQFVADASSISGVTPHCYDCERWVKLERMFSITQQDYENILALQNHRCALCQKDRCITGKNFAVDHDHDCCPGDRSCGECIRGLLCSAPCNWGLEMNREKPQQEAYLARYAALDRPLVQVAREFAEEAQQAA